MTSPSLLAKFLKSKWRNPRVVFKNKHGEIEAEIGQGDPVIEITFKKPLNVARFVSKPSLTFSEAYIKGDVEISGDLLSLIAGLYRSSNIVPKPLQDARYKLGHRKVKEDRAAANAQHHYDLGNEFYQLWLDPTLTYTCAYFLDQTESLETAQRRKIRLVSEKARLKPSQTILEFGCGWGPVLFAAVEDYNVAHATGVTPSAEQAKFIRQQAKQRGLTDRITVIEGDWRDAKPDIKYDRIISVGILEHVGLKQYDEFFQLHADLMKPDGIAFTHAIGHTKPTPPDPFITKYIFPDGELNPIDTWLVAAATADLRLVDLENLRQHYALTLEHWHRNFMNAREQIVTMYDEPFARMWELYLLGSQAGFTAGNLCLFQCVFTGPEASWPFNREVNVEQL